MFMVELEGLALRKEKSPKPAFIRGQRWPLGVRFEVTTPFLESVNFFLLFDNKRLLISQTDDTRAEACIVISHLVKVANGARRNP